MVRSVGVFVLLCVSSLTWGSSPVLWHTLAGAGATMAECYAVYSTLNYIEQVLFSNSCPASEEMAQYVSNCCQHMTDVDTCYVENMDVRVLDADFAYNIAIQSGIHHDLPNTFVIGNTFYIANFFIPTSEQESETWARIQYMLVAHEMGHVMRDSMGYLRSLQYVFRGVLTLLCPAAASLFAAQNSAVWSHVGVFTTTYALKSFIVLVLLVARVRTEEHHADGYAFRQARDVEDIKALQYFFDIITDEDVPPWYHTLSLTKEHPHPQYRKEHGEQYIQAIAANS